ncbi:MAG: hypothetical protein HYT16_00930 [DPANN group archaeon]|nr:hypothetical protein [DPANN group archaeon]
MAKKYLLCATFTKIIPVILAIMLMSIVGFSISGAIPQKGQGQQQGGGQATPSQQPIDLNVSLDAASIVKLPFNYTNRFVQYPNGSNISFDHGGTGEIFYQISFKVKNEAKNDAVVPFNVIMCAEKIIPRGDITCGYYNTRFDEKIGKLRAGEETTFTGTFSVLDNSTIDNTSYKLLAVVMADYKQNLPDINRLNNFARLEFNFP